MRGSGAGASGGALRSGITREDMGFWEPFVHYGPPTLTHKPE